jgi:hypothetical protein
MHAVLQKLASLVIKDLLVESVMRKKEPEKKPVKAKGKRKVVQEVKDDYEFSPKRATVTAIIAAALSYGVSGGYISTESADCLQDVGQEVVEKQL